MNQQIHLKVLIMNLICQIFLAWYSFWSCLRSFHLAMDFWLFHYSQPAQLFLVSTLAVSTKVAH